MSLLDVLIARLDTIPDLQYTATETRVEVLPADDEGFLVGIELDPGGQDITVDFGNVGWHQHFWGDGPDAEVEALYTFGLGLSEQCRVRVITYGSWGAAWIAERQLDVGWVEYGRVVNPVVPFWKPKHTRILQNHFIDRPQALIPDDKLPSPPPAHWERYDETSRMAARHSIHIALFLAVLGLVIAAAGLCVGLLLLTN